MKELEDLFVPYNEAVVLKELGFNEFCFGAFYADVDSNKTDKYDVRKKFTAELDISPFNNETRGLFKNSDKDYYIARPTYSQAFKFFRKKYNLEYNIGGVTEVFQKQEKFVGYHFKIWNNKINDDIFIPFITKDYKDKTYEEAELACLRKLIEIVKEK